MSTMCGYPGDREAALIAYVYGESTAEERVAFDAHLATCARCRSEVAGFENVRQQIVHWSPPDFLQAGRTAAGAVVATPRRIRLGWREIPVWAQVAAALLVLGVSAGIANLNIHYDATSGLDVHTGWRDAGNLANRANPSNLASPSNSATASSAANRANSGSGSSPWRADLAALEQQLRREMHASPAADPAPAGRAASPGDAELMRRVKALVDESEKRQQRELALRVTALMQDINARRQADLRRIDQNLGLIQDRTGVEVLRNRQMIDYYLQRVSQRP
jgi:hypothetical protein